MNQRILTKRTSQLRTFVRNRTLLLLTVNFGWISTALLAAEEQLSAQEVQGPVSFQQVDSRIRINVGEQPIAEYVFHDEEILRPYFRHLRTLAGEQVTRTHPPAKGQDLGDHASMHPGLSLAFGDLDGADFWRNKGQIQHIGFIEEPTGGNADGSFSVRNEYTSDGRTICIEDCEISVTVRPDAYLLSWNSTFRSEQAEFTFGDQEEMGLGVRVATPLAVVKGGTITDSEGRKNGAQVWGKQADWCEYSGVVDGRRIGVALMPGQQNFRRSWFHARDYGLLVANPFGQNAFTKSEKSRVVVKKGDNFQLKIRRVGLFTSGNKVIRYPGCVP